jgi:hypothetical protein
MKFKNNWDKIKMSKQQLKLAKAAKNQKRMTEADLFGAGSKKETSN